MATLNQRVKVGKERKEHWKSNVKLRKCPLRRGIVTMVFVGSPKKPNSGKRKLAKVVLNTGKKAIVTIPDGYQHGGQALQKYNKVLIRGGRCRDMPGAHYKILRTMGDRRNDTMGGALKRKQKRSKYGVFKVA